MNGVEPAPFAPAVLPLVRTTVCAVPGVARLAADSAVQDGVVVRPSNGGVLVDCYLVAAADTNLHELGLTVQAAVAAVLHTIAGLVAQEVNVYILDVEFRRG